MKDKPPRISFQPTGEQHDFIEGIRKRHGIPKSTYVASLVKGEMEKSEDRLRPILSVKTASPHGTSPRDVESGLISPPTFVPFGTKTNDIKEVVSVNSEVKALIRDGKIRKAESWAPKATV